ncbi:MAG: hypothetical protein R3321_14270 [Nitrososphaeraceae archaeon]|nr:hypothetical protein [Nitrososphaeraceae archaeon]
MADLDNLRISNASRPISVLIGGFGLGPDSVSTLPVIEDNFTTSLDDFDEEEAEQEGGAILIDRETGVFDFTVNVIDSFDKVRNDEECRQLIIDLLNVIKPAHTRVEVIFLE